jgi:hypothetical protein
MLETVNILTNNVITNDTMWMLIFSTKIILQSATIYLTNRVKNCKCIEDRWNKFDYHMIIQIKFYAIPIWYDFHGINI